MLAKRGLSLRTDLLKPLVNWLSPDFAHRRFNTRYFAATVPMNQQPTHPGEQGRLGPVGVRHEGRSPNATPPPWVTRWARRTPSGLTLGQLLVPGSEIMLEKMATANGCIAYLSYKRKPHVYQPKLVDEDGTLMLEVEAAKDRSRRAPARALNCRPAPRLLPSRLVASPTLLSLRCSCDASSGPVEFDVRDSRFHESQRRVSTAQQRAFAAVS